MVIKDTTHPGMVRKNSGSHFHESSQYVEAGELLPSGKCPAIHDKRNMRRFQR
jgi:hypothetical protein